VVHITPPPCPGGKGEALTLVHSQHTAGLYTAIESPAFCQEVRPWYHMQEVATLAVVDDREVARQEELCQKEEEYAEAVKTQHALLLLV